METVVLIALLMGLFGLASIPLFFWARALIWIKFMYFLKKGKGAKIVDYYSSDGDHQLFCVVPDENGSFRVNKKLYNIAEGTVRWSRAFNGRLVVCQDTSTATFDPVSKDIKQVPPSLIEDAMVQIKNAEQKRAMMFQNMKEKDWMFPAMLLCAGAAAILSWLALQGQIDVIAACTVPAAKVITQAAANGTVFVQ